MTTTDSPRTSTKTSAPATPPAREGIGGRVLSMFSHSFLAIWGVMVTLPLLWTVLQSFKNDGEILREPLGLPEEWLWGAYGRAWSKGHIGEYFMNTLIVLLFGVGITMLIGAMAAYVLARFRFPGNRFIYWLFVAGLTVPIYLGILPLYLTVGDVGEALGIEHVVVGSVDFGIGRGTYGGLILVYIAYSMPFTIFFLHAFFKTLPTTIAEAAAVDGAGNVRTFFQVMLPMAKPGLVAIGIFNVIGQWNQFILPIVLMKDGDPKVLTQGLLELANNARSETDFAITFAGMTLAMVPILAVYLVFHRQVQAGLTGATSK